MANDNQKRSEFREYMGAYMPTPIPQVNNAFTIERRYQYWGLIGAGLLLLAVATAYMMAGLLSGQGSLSSSISPGTILQVENSQADTIPLSGPVSKPDSVSTLQPGQTDTDLQPTHMETPVVSNSLFDGSINQNIEVLQGATNGPAVLQMQ